MITSRPFTWNAHDDLEAPTPSGGLIVVTFTGEGLVADEFDDTGEPIDTWAAEWDNLGNVAEDISDLFPSRALTDAVWDRLPAGLRNALDPG